MTDRDEFATVADILQRLTWLENIFSSPIIAPIKFMNRRFGFGQSKSLSV
jgi:hypothetical protein